MRFVCRGRRRGRVQAGVRGRGGGVGGINRFTGGRTWGAKEEATGRFILFSRRRTGRLGEKGLRRFLWSRDIGDLKLGGTRTRWGRGRRRRWSCCSMIAWCRLRGGWEKRGRD